MYELAATKAFLDSRESYLIMQVVVMVLESTEGICGYAFGVPSVSQHTNFVQNEYLPAVWNTVCEHLKHESSVTIMDLCDSMAYSTEDNLDPFLSAEFPGFVQVGMYSSGASYYGKIRFIL